SFPASMRRSTARTPDLQSTRPEDGRANTRLKFARPSLQCGALTRLVGLRRRALSHGVHGRAAKRPKRMVEDIRSGLSSRILARGGPGEHQRRWSWLARLQSRAFVPG